MIEIQEITYRYPQAQENALNGVNRKKEERRAEKNVLPRCVIKFFSLFVVLMRDRRIPFRIV